MNIEHHRKGVGQDRHRDVIDDDGHNKVEARDADELEMGNGGKRNRDKQNREHGTNNNGKATGEHARHWLKILKNVSVPLPLCLVACCASFNLGSRISPSIFPYTYTGHMNKSLSESTQNKNKPAHRGLAINAEILHGINEFKQLFNKTDKTFRHGYHWLYGRWFQQYKFKENLAILEIGSRTGESAQAWTEYFGPNTYVDMITYGGKGDHLKFNNPTVECKRGNTGEDEDEEGNDAGQCGHIHTFYCDQSDAEKLEKEVIAERPHGWDIVIDDGSHVPAHNIISFEVLWKNVRPGGIYVVEDIETSYYPKSNIYGYGYEAGILAPSPLNALSRFRQYADVINRGYIGPHGRMYSLFEGDDSALSIFKEQSKELDKWRVQNEDSI